MKAPNCLIFSLLVAGLATGLAKAQDDRELTELRAAIAGLERELERQIDRRDDGVAELKTIEQSLADTRARLANTGSAIAEQGEKQAAIGRDIAAANANLAGQQQALSAQIRMSYMMGRQEFVKMLLSQESPADFGRMLAYYDYLNRHRSDRIGAVATELTKLAALNTDAAHVARELEALRGEQEAAAAKLEADRQQRQSLIARLDTEIASSGSEIDRMRQEEAHLNEVISRLAEEMKAFSFPSEEAFSKQRGKLPWPVNGTPAARFGEARDSSGRVRWTGVLLEAEFGSVVRAVYYGRVIHAQWQPGMGLLLILEHGEGYYSLYGHNSALLREPGDWVEPGDPIAEVGDTGGQQGSALFFGIRLDGGPIDPTPWMR